MTWSRGMMNEDVISMIIGIQTAGEICLTLKKTMLPLITEQESWLKDNLYSLKKGSSKLEDFLQKFKSICNNPNAIGKPKSNEDKNFQLTCALEPPIYISSLES